MSISSAISSSSVCPTDCACVLDISREYVVMHIDAMLEFLKRQAHKVFLCVPNDGQGWSYVSLCSNPTACSQFSQAEEKAILIQHSEKGGMNCMAGKNTHKQSLPTAH